MPASQAAAQTSDTRAYREARRAERAGKPLAPVAITPATDTAPAAVAAPAAEPTLSRRQQDANERTRKAVEQATADLRAENERLKAAAAPPIAPPIVAAPPVADVAPDPSDTAKYPAGEFDPKFLRDIAVFEAREVLRQDKTAAAQQAESEAALAADHARVASYVDRIKAQVANEPEFWSHVTTEVANIKTFGALKEGEPAGPINVIAEEVLSSDVSPALMKLLSAPDAAGTPNAHLRRLQAGPPTLTTLPVGQRMGEHTRWILREIAKLETQVGSVATTSPAPKTATSMPAPLTILGTRPATAADPLAAAVSAGDSRTYRQLRREQRAGTRRT